MDNEIDTMDNMQPTSSFKKTTPLTGIGARLKAAREALHLTEKDAAGRLHLSVRFIDVMENEDFTNGPPFTFMRGYLRSYARVLNIPSKEIDNAIEALGMNSTEKLSTASPLIWESTGGGMNFDPYVRWFSYLIFFVLIVLAGIWWNSRSSENETVTKTSHSSSTVVTQPAKANANPVSGTSQPSTSQPPAMNNNPTAAPTAQQAQPAPVIPVPQQTQSTGQLQAAPTPAPQQTQPAGQLQAAPVPQQAQPAGQLQAAPVPQQAQPAAQLQTLPMPEQSQAPIQSGPAAAPLAPQLEPTNQTNTTTATPIQPIQNGTGNPPNIPNSPNAPNPSNIANQPNIPNEPNIPNRAGTMGTSPAQPIETQPLDSIPGALGEAQPNTEQNANTHHKHRKHRSVHMRMAVPEPGLY